MSKVSYARLRFRDFKQFLAYRKKEMLLGREFGKAKKLREQKDRDFNEFKKSLFDEIDKYFKQDIGEVAVKPNYEYIHLFEKLLRDRDFLRHYSCKIKKGNEVRIRARGEGDLYSEE